MTADELVQIAFATAATASILEWTFYTRSDPYEDI
jgi:hypothetical protein